MSNAYRAVQRHIDNLPDPGPTDRRRSIEHQRLDAIWKLAYAKADQGDVPAMRVLVEISRCRALLDGLGRPEVWQIESGPRDLGQQHVPKLREVLPPELAADARAVREQALLVHRALPMPNVGQVSTST